VIQPPESSSCDTAGYLISIEIRHSDLNHAGHVGNAEVARIVDEARTRFFCHPHPNDGDRGRTLLGVLPVTVAKVIGLQTIEYRRELTYSPNPLLATVWISHIGTSSFSVATTITHTEPAPAVIAEATYVLTEQPNRCSWPIDRTLRELLNHHFDEPPILRNRPSLTDIN
jgi:acyl-CoA thioester hydrolase